MNRLPTLVTITLLALIGAPGHCQAATGDVSFRAANRTINLDPMSPEFSVDVLFEVEGLTEVPALGWGMVVDITPQANAVGTLQFNPPPIVDDEPNLAAASTNPFIDFDRDFGGMSYGLLGDVESRLHAFSTYISPTVGPPPTLDADGNLLLPHGSGLASLPLIASADAAGSFAITFDPDPAFTGVILATGQPEPNDIGVHPVGQHFAGMVTVVPLAGDYNLNGTVDAADYTVWRDGLGDAFDAAHYDQWKLNFGATTASSAAFATASRAAVPEPASLFMVVCAAGLTLGPRKRFAARGGHRSGSAR